MLENIVHKKIIELAAEEISRDQFFILLKKSRESNPIRVEWFTNEGRRRYYWMWWEPGPISEARTSGRKMSNTKRREGMYNIQTDEEGDWRTLTLDSVTKCRFENKLFYIS